MNKNPPEVFIILLDAVIKLFDVSLIEKPQNFLLKLPTAFARDDFDETDFLFKRLFNDAIELGVDLVAMLIDVVQVELKFCHYFFFSFGRNSNGGRWFSLIKFAPNSLTYNTVTEPVSQLNLWK